MERRAKAIRCLTICGIGTDFLDFTVDRNPYKHGRFTPGRHIPIRPVSAIDEARPDYVLIVPWNLRQEIASHRGIPRHFRALATGLAMTIRQLSGCTKAQAKIGSAIISLSCLTAPHILTVSVKLLRSIVSLPG
jgi:hypothetical protein